MIAALWPQLRQKYNTKRTMSFFKKSDLFQLLAHANARNVTMGKNRPHSSRPEILPALIVAAYWIGVTTALSQPSDSVQGFETCKSIASDKARLDCLRKLLPKSSTDAAPADDGAAVWRLIRTSRPNGASDSFAIMRTANTIQSDPDLAGLMIRCQEKPGLEVVLALVRPLPPRSKRDVVVNSGATETLLHAESSSPGTALVLPIEATAFTTGPFRGLNLLSVKVKDPEGDIRGVIPLDGITSAVARLSASCPSG